MPPRDVCTTVATARRGGLPDQMIAANLGVTVEQLRRMCPNVATDPLGLFPPRPAPVPVPAPTPREDNRRQETPPWGTVVRGSDDGSAFAILLLFFLLSS